MSNSMNPRLAVNLTPHFNNSGSATHISVKLTIGGLNGGLQGGSQPQKGQPILFFEDVTVADGQAALNSSLETLEASDERGYLELRPESVFAGQAWQVNRPVQGDVIVQLDVLPIPGDAQPWNSKALRQDQDGLIGVGQSLMPRPARDGLYDITLEWDLSQAPEGTRGVTSLGEGSVSTTKNPEVLLNCVFMVGRINSCPPDVSSADSSGFCGTYWLGNLPANLESLKDFGSNMFPHLSKFFKDENGSYRVFLGKGRGGLRSTSLVSSSLVDYDDDTKDEHDWELVRLLNKSLIANWAKLDAEDDGTENDWFNQGIAHLYSIYLPFRFGQRTPDYFRATLNGFMTAYFTNPLKSLPLHEAAAHPYATWHAESAVSMRGCVYMIRMDCFTRRASQSRNAGVARPIDEIMADICTRRQRGEKVQTKDWLAYLGDWMGLDVAEERLKSMKDGVVMDMKDMETVFSGINAEEQQVMEMGFDKISLESGIVSGVEEGSKSFLAGLRNGDEIKWHSRLEVCETDYEKKFKLLVERQGEKVDVEYWPRGDKSVGVWLSRKKET